jgi:hypothetical protein
MRPRGYRVSDPTFWYDPRTGKRVSFDAFLKIVDQILATADRAREAYDRAAERWVEGVPPARRSYWKRRLSSTRAGLDEAEAFAREIDAQLSRPSGPRTKPAPAPPPKAAAPRYHEYELGLDYSTALAHADTSAVDINIRFRRKDDQPFTEHEAWSAVRAYRLSEDGRFPPEYFVEAIDWKRLRRGRRRAQTIKEILDALHDFLLIAGAMNKSDMTLGGLRLGSIKEG